MRLGAVLAITAVAAAATWSSAAASAAHRTRHVRRDARVVTTRGAGHVPRVPTPPVTPPPAPGGPPSPPPKPLGHLQVRAREFSLTLSRTTLGAGRVAVELDNLGQDPHDLRVERTDDPGTGFDFALAKSGTRSTKQLDLGPGTWKLYCTLPGHDQAGMHAQVTVGR